MKAIAQATLLGPVYQIKKIETKSGKPMTAFTMRIWKSKGEKEDKVMFINCVAYSKAAEVLSRYLVDGKLVYLDTDIDLYKDKNGNDRVQYIVREFSFLGDNQKEVLNASNQETTY